MTQSKPETRALERAGQQARSENYGILKELKTHYLRFLIYFRALYLEANVFFPFIFPFWRSSMSIIFYLFILSYDLATETHI
jgi:hypothetical protein